jgi:hypothetical protein
VQVDGLLALAVTVVVYVPGVGVQPLTLPLLPPLLDVPPELLAEPLLDALPELLPPPLLLADPLELECPPSPLVPPPPDEDDEQAAAPAAPSAPHRRSTPTPFT